MDIFCKIINGEVPTNKIYEDELVRVFEIDDKTFTHMWKVARDMEKLFEKKLHSNGATFEINYGIIQEVKHLHLHIIPRYKYEDIADVEEIYKVLQS